MILSKRDLASLSSNIHPSGVRCIILIHIASLEILFVFIFALMLITDAFALFGLQCTTRVAKLGAAGAAAAVSMCAILEQGSTYDMWLQPPNLSTT